MTQLQPDSQVKDSWSYFPSWYAGPGYQPDADFEQLWPQLRNHIVTRKKGKEYVRRTTILFCEKYRVLNPHNATKHSEALFDEWSLLLIEQKEQFECDQAKVEHVQNVIVAAFQDGVDLMTTCLELSLKRRSVTCLLAKLGLMDRGDEFDDEED
ncbi:hypothetical protein BH24DEI2_BH24DEI2_22680 [soil metagenome]